MLTIRHVRTILHVPLSVSVRSATPWHVVQSRVKTQSDIMAVGIVYRYHKPHPRDTKGKCIVHNLLFEREAIPAETPPATVVRYLRYE